MNRAQTSAIVLLLAAAAAAHEQESYPDPEGLRLVACLDPTMQASAPPPQDPPAPLPAAAAFKLA